MNEVTLRESNTAIVLPDQVDLIRRTVAKDVSMDELVLYFYDCKRQGVHPLDRLIHFTKRKGKYTPITSVEFLYMRAHSTGEFDGQDKTLFEGDPGKNSFEATVTVYRKKLGRDKSPFTATARWSEYYPGDGDIGFMWRKFVHRMLEKCAEALALRKAFADVLHGLYIREEMDQAERPANDTRSLKEKVQAKMAQPVVSVEPEGAASTASEVMVSATELGGPEADAPSLPPTFTWGMGKYKGTPIEDLPVDYLIWAMEKVQREDHREAARIEIERRHAQEVMSMEAQA